MADNLTTVMGNRINQDDFWEAMPPQWDVDEEEELICCGVRNETPDVKTFTFRTPLGRLFYFYPGQHITLLLTINGEPISRCYSISSPPTRPNTISITVKRKPGGIVSTWLHDNLHYNMRMRVLPPAGNFTCATYPTDKYLLLSAGSGVTPIMSMVRAFRDLADDRDIAFVHSARTPDDIIFLEELTRLTREQEYFRTFFVCEDRGNHHEWSSPTGFLNLAWLHLCVPDFLEREVFLCGPAPYMDSVKGMLADAGYPMEKLHQETYEFEKLERVEDNLSPQPAEPINIEDVSHINVFNVGFERSGHNVPCVSTQSVLDAAIQAGVHIPYSCRQGICGTCKSKIISGQVDMKPNGGITQREIDKGMALICVSTPLSDLVIDR